MYMKLKNALCVNIQAALLFWSLLLDTYIEWGFKLNDYDKCVTSRQCMGIMYDNMYIPS